MSDDIVTRLRGECQCSDDCRAVNDPCIPMQAADEIERLHEELKNADDDFHVLKSMFDKTRADRDRWFKIARDLYVWSIGILGEHMTTAAVQAYEKAVRSE